MHDNWVTLWVDALGRALLVEKADGDEKYPWRVTTTPGLQSPPYDAATYELPDESMYRFQPDGTLRMPARWNATSKKPHLQVECESPGFGRTLALYFVVWQQNREYWLPARADDPLESISVLLDTQPSFTDAVAWMDDEAEIPWVYPYEDMRAATATERARFASAHPGLVVP